MTVRVRCSNPRCGAIFEMSEDELGQAGFCPECGTGFALNENALAETMGYDPHGASASDIPARLGRYEVVRKLGEGGMGAVYLARDTQLDRQVALKVPHAALRDLPEVVQRFHREAKAAARFQHPNFCPIHEVGQAEGWNYLAMAYIEGQTLASMIARDGPMPLRRAAAIARKLALALQEAHDQGITHRDLKPSNVMVNRRSELIIMDFGLARREGSDDPELTRDGVVLGSPHYMAPEQVRAERDAIGPATDIYALGVMLYEMLTGRRPFVGSMSLVLGLIATSKPDPPSERRPDLDPELETICLRAMAREPSDRYPSMIALAAALEAYLGRPQRTAWAAPGPVAAGAGGQGRLPPVEDIQLVPEPEVDDRSAPRFVIDDEDESDSAYSLAVETVADAPEPAGGDAWLGTFADEPRPARKDVVKTFVPSASPKAVARRARRGTRRLLVDISYVLVCAGVLAVGLGLIVNWATTGRGTIQIMPPTSSAVIRVDGRVVSPEDLKQPIELRIGEHELLVTQDDRIIASQKIQIDLGTNPPFRVRPDSKPGSKLPARR